MVIYPSDKDFLPFTLAVDFDGVMMLAGEWKGKEVAENDPVNLEQMKSELKRLRNAGWKIIVWSARVDEELIKQWLERHGLLFKYIDAININPWAPDNLVDARKIPATVYLDDRGISFTGQWEGMAAAVQSFVPWQRATTLRPDSGDKLFIDATPNKANQQYIKCQSCIKSASCFRAQYYTKVDCIGFYLSQGAVVADECDHCEVKEECICLSNLKLKGEYNEKPD